MRKAARKQSPFRQLEFCFRPAGSFSASICADLQDVAASLWARSARKNWQHDCASNGIGACAPQWVGPICGVASFRSIPLCNNSVRLKSIERCGMSWPICLRSFRFCKRRRILPHGREWRNACCDLGIASERAGHTLPFDRARAAASLHLSLQEMPARFFTGAPHPPRHRLSRLLPKVCARQLR